MPAARLNHHVRHQGGRILNENRAGSWLHSPSLLQALTRRLEDGRGRPYTLISAGRPPPRSLLAPGPWGMGMRLGVAAVISALVSFILARYLVAPLSQLGRTSRRLATGDLAVRVGAPLDRRRDEFGQLARDLDEMAHRLQSSQQANRRRLGPQLDGNMALLIPVFGIRHDFSIDKTAQLGAPLRVLGS